MGFHEAGATPDSATYLQRLIADAESTRLWEQRAWRKLLLIPDRWYPSDRSLVDDPTFFFAPDGREDPRAELLATLSAFFSPPPAQPPERYMHPQCRSPARLDWLVSALNIDRSRLPAIDCDELESFIDFLRYEKASLVFSNYYLDNPASMFGHSFLRLHRAKKENVNDTALFDDIVNFSAFVSDMDSWLYPLKGLSGAYPGRFSLMPYYRKIQEYAKFESRDLWEYELNLSAAELRRLEKVLWELGGIHIDYYYLDDNCSYIMLALLEAAKPELRLTGNLKLYAVPADTIRAVTRTPNLVRGIHYRPSALARFKSAYGRLSAENQSRLERLVVEGEKKADVLSGCDVICQADVIDAAVEYIDFKEKVAGSREPERYGKLRTDLLTMRARTLVKREAAPVVPVSSPPHLGHDAGLVAVGGGLYEGEGGFAEIRWRPALHELGADELGYSNSLAIGFLDTILRYDGDSRRGELKNLHFFEIMSLPEKTPMIESFAWHLDLGYERGAGFGLGDQGRDYLQGGFGYSLFTPDRRGALFAIAQADAGYANDLGWHVGPQLMAGGMIRLASFAKLLFRSDVARRFGLEGTVDSARSTLGATFFLRDNIELRFNASKVDGRGEIMAALYGYY